MSLPAPIATHAVVFHDPASRTLHVRLSDQTDGYTKLLWQQGWMKLRRAEEAGWPANGAPWVYGSTSTADRVVHGVPATPAW